jgi:hypothetical protein
MPTRRLRILILALLAAAPAVAADGDFDPAFDGDGIHFYTSPGSYGSAMVRAPDDAVLVWGTRSEATSASEVHWRRVAAGGVGALCTFTPAGAEYVAARGAAFDPDGRLLIAVAVETPVSGGTDQRVWVARLANSYLFADGFERGSTAGW